MDYSMQINQSLFKYIVLFLINIPPDTPLKQ